MDKIQSFIEKKAFGVCSYIGEKLGIAEDAVRMYFIYASFLTFGSPILIYLALAFWVNVRKYLRLHEEPKERTIFF